MKTFRAIFFGLIIALLSAAPNLCGGKADRDLDDPIERHRKVALTANGETRAYAILHSQELRELTAGWDAAKPQSGRLRDYLSAHDPEFKALTARWKKPYSDQKLLSVLIYTSRSAGLLNVFGFMAPDDDLIKDFTAHRVDYEALRTMLEEDRAKGLKSVANDKTDPAELDRIGLNPERLKAYREKMAAAKVTLISITSDPEFYHDGISFVWLPSPPEATPDGSVRVVPNLKDALNRQLQADAAFADEHPHEPKAHARLYRQIDEHWYLESERQPPH